MEELLKQILAEVKGLKEGQQQTNQRLDRMETDLSELKTTVSNMDGQTRENTDFIKALLHRTEELNAMVTNLGFNNAKLEGLLANTATKEDVNDLSAQFRVLNDRLFRQEVEVDKLKAVK